MSRRPGVPRGAAGVLSVRVPRGVRRVLRADLRGQTEGEDCGVSM